MNSEATVYYKLLCSLQPSASTLARLVQWFEIMKAGTRARRRCKLRLRRYASTNWCQAKAILHQIRELTGTRALGEHRQKRLLCEFLEDLLLDRWNEIQGGCLLTFWRISFLPAFVCEVAAAVQRALRVVETPAALQFGKLCVKQMWCFFSAGNEDGVLPCASWYEGDCEG